MGETGRQREGESVSVASVVFNPSPAGFSFCPANEGLFLDLGLKVNAINWLVGKKTISALWTEIGNRGFKLTALTEHIRM